MPQAHSAEFINLPNKQPHGPIANSRPLTNLSTMWKRTSALVKNHYHPSLVANCILLPDQLGIYPHRSSVELLRVLHDVWWDRSRRCLEPWVLSNDVRHAYRSLSHNTEHAVMVAAGISNADALVHIATNGPWRSILGEPTAEPHPLPVCEPARGKGARCHT